MTWSKRKTATGRVGRAGSIPRRFVQQTRSPGKTGRRRLGGKRRSSRWRGSFSIHIPVLCLLLCLFILGMFHPHRSPRRDVAQLKSILASLPADLSPLRRRFVIQCCDLVGRVDYFWGGKPEHPGWDRRWGRPTTVTAPGGQDTGKRLPYGLDCSGLVSWAAVTAAGDMDAYQVIGDGVRDQYAKCTPLPWASAQPGDLVFFPDLSHVGIVVGWGMDGALLAVHCSHSLGGVVLSQDAGATGFALVGHPVFFGGPSSFPSPCPLPTPLLLPPILTPFPAVPPPRSLGWGGFLLYFIGQKRDVSLFFTAKIAQFLQN